MVEAPGVSVTCRFASKTSIDGVTDPSSLSRIRRLCDDLTTHFHPLVRKPLAITVAELPPVHTGLGTGTQLSLAVGRAICALVDVAPTPLELATATGRGQRSAIGVHGFFEGGLLVDGGRSEISRLAPAIARVQFPVDWPILLVNVPIPARWHGTREDDVFAGFTGNELDSVGDRMCRILVSGVLPSAIERDYAAFGEALFEYNRNAGEFFAKAQGGAYADPAISDLIQALRSWGIPGVGQSSWGPTVFAILPDHDAIARIRSKLLDAFDLSDDCVTTTRSKNTGAECVALQSNEIADAD